MDRRVTPPKRVTSPTWGPPPPCKQALKLQFLPYSCRFIYLTFANTGKHEQNDEIRHSSFRGSRPDEIKFTDMRCILTTNINICRGESLSIPSRCLYGSHFFFFSLFTPALRSGLWARDTCYAQGTSSAGYKRNEKYQIKQACFYFDFDESISCRKQTWNRASMLTWLKRVTDFRSHWMVMICESVLLKRKQTLSWIL